jgi:hypothetical protein
VLAECRGCVCVSRLIHIVGSNTFYVIQRSCLCVTTTLLYLPVIKEYSCDQTNRVGTNFPPYRRGCSSVEECDTFSRRENSALQSAFMYCVLVFLSFLSMKESFRMVGFIFIYSSKKSINTFVLYALFRNIILMDFNLQIVVSVAIHY